DEIVVDRYVETGAGPVIETFAEARDVDKVGVHAGVEVAWNGGAAGRQVQLERGERLNAGETHVGDGGGGLGIERGRHISFDAERLLARVHPAAAAEQLDLEVARLADELPGIGNVDFRSAAGLDVGLRRALGAGERAGRHGARALPRVV